MEIKLPTISRYWLINNGNNVLVVLQRLLHWSIKTNRKSYALYHMMTLPMTLGDP